MSTLESFEKDVNVIKCKEGFEGYPWDWKIKVTVDMEKIREAIRILRSNPDFTGLGINVKNWELLGEDEEGMDEFYELETTLSPEGVLKVTLEADDEAMIDAVFDLGEFKDVKPQVLVTMINSENGEPFCLGVGDVQKIIKDYELDPAEQGSSWFTQEVDCG